MKRFLSILSIAVALVLVTGCGISRIGQIEVTSVGIKYVVPTSSKSVDTKLRLGIYNPSVNFTVSDVEGTVKYKGEDFGYLTAGRIDVEKNCEKFYDLPCTATLAENVSLLDVAKLGLKGSLDGLTADLKLHVKLKNGPGATLKFKDLDLTTL